MYRLIPLIIFSMLSLQFCKSFPESEMLAARNTISAAERANAPKYAPEKLKAAKATFAAAEQLGKKKKYDEAEAGFNKSKNQAYQAYFNSLRKFVEKEEQETSKARAEAMKSHIEKAVPEDYKKAEALYQKMQSSRTQMGNLSAELNQLETEKKDD